jgi:hypothetical protein
MQFVLYGGLIFMGYLIDIPNDGACFFTCLAYYAIYCEKHSLQKSPILTTDVASTREQLCNFLLANRDLIMIKGKKNPLTVHLYFLATYAPNAVFRKAVHLEDSLHSEILCDTFDEYLEVMRNPVAHADEIFVWAASMMFNIKLSVLEHFVPRIVDPKLRDLVEMGYPRTAAEHALQQCSGNLYGAVNYLLQHPPESSESAVVWREDDPYNQAGAFEVRFVRKGSHYELILPQYAPRELEPTLPPRTRKKIVAAQVMWKEDQQSQGCGGGAAAVSAKPPPSSRIFSAGGGAAVLEQPTHQTKILSTKEMWEKYQQSQGCGGGSAAVPAPAAQPFRNFSAGGGGGAAVPEQPAQSFRKHSASDGDAELQHQQKCSFGHSQPPYPPRKPAYPPSQIVVFDGSDISGLISKFAFYYAIIHLVKKSGLCTSSFKVTNLTLVKDALETACKDGVKVFGSFITSEDGSPEIRFRAVEVKFDDNSVVKHPRTVANLSDPNENRGFVDSVNREWKSSMITEITFAMCI